MENKKKRALIAEDNPGLAHVLNFNLEQAGFEVTACENGALAWEEAKKQVFDVVVTDHEMPEMTGVELCRCLRGLPAFNHVPIVMVTAREMELDVKRLRTEFGLAAIFAKPYSPGELLKLIESVMAQA